MKKTLLDLLDQISHQSLERIKLTHPELLISGVTSDSREVKEGTVFVAIRGMAEDGHQYLEEAQKKGAVLLIGENPPSPQIQVPYAQVEESRFVLSQLAACFFDHPSDDLLMIGVTGTSGKTTTTYLIESVLKAAGYRVGVIGTIQSRFEEKVFPSTLTTPGVVQLQKTFFEMKRAGCTAVVMEVSSHALKQKRVARVAFDGMVFTNLSPEHLDFHSDMEDYYLAKCLLFTEVARYSTTRGKTPVGVINQEDEYGCRLLKELLSQSENFIQPVGFQVEGDLHISMEGISGKILVKNQSKIGQDNRESVFIHSPLTGQFNASNIAAAFSLAQELGISNAKITQGIADLKGVPGRLEKVSHSASHSQGIHVWVDYAHKPDALFKVLRVLKEIRGENRLITVFGCGGDRDRKKRPRMGKIAVEGSDLVFVTSDNPRTEDPMSIIQEILLEIQSSPKVQIQVSRRQAIFDAIQTAKSGDLVLIAGKGHEDYQIIGKNKIYFDDREVAREALGLS